ncbi:GNAT family N-acetyltransferase [Aestuariibius sp. HNIBRBA575]|uniref:GNAT family N-acetyltransferase n=1 Tax=Aestuariibius sp. HNIBRBA575 TaxID=3233343 RepID=UPI0034A4B41C
MTAMHLCSPDDLPRILPLVARFHEEIGIASEEDHREAAIKPLLDGSPLGAVYLMGPARAPVGYVVITFGWSVEFGGIDAFVDELFIRPSVRGRGLATEALLALSKALSQGGVRALHLEVATEDQATIRLYQRNGFSIRDGYHLMSKSL